MDQPGDEIAPIATPHLQLVSMSVPFMEALAAKDLATASAEIGATVPSGSPTSLRTS